MGKTTLQKLADLYAFLCFLSKYFEFEYVPEKEQFAAEYLEQGIEIVTDAHKTMGGAPADLDAREAEFLREVIGLSRSRVDMEKENQETGRDPLIIGTEAYPSANTVTIGQDLDFVSRVLNGNSLNIVRLSLYPGSFSALFHLSQLVEAFDRDPHFQGKKIPEDFTLEQIASHYLATAISEARKAREAKQKEEAEAMARAASVGAFDWQGEKISWSEKDNFCERVTIDIDAPENIKAKELFQKLFHEFNESGPGWISNAKGFTLKTERPGESPEQLHNKVTEGLASWDKETRDRAVRHVTVNSYHDAVIGFFDGFNRVARGQTTASEEEISRLSGIISRQATSLKARDSEIAMLENQLSEARSACNSNAEQANRNAFSLQKEQHQNNILSLQISNSDILIEKYCKNEIGLNNQLNTVIDELNKTQKEREQLRAALQAEQTAKCNTVEQLAEVKELLSKECEKSNNNYSIGEGYRKESERLRGELRKANDLQEKISAAERGAEEEKKIRVEVAEANASLRAQNKELDASLLQKAEQIEGLQKQVSFYESENRRQEANRRELLLTLGENAAERKRLARENANLHDSVSAWIARGEVLENQLKSEEERAAKIAADLQAVKAELSPEKYLEILRKEEN